MFDARESLGARVLLLATLGMGGVVYLLSPPTDMWRDWGWGRRVAQMALVCGLGGATYLTVHLVLGTRLKHLRAPAAP